MRRVHFPIDEASHPSRTEWWYYNGHLTAEDGSEYSIMVTFFKLDLAKNRMLEILPSKTMQLLYPFIEGRIVNAHISDLTNKKYHPHYLHFGKIPVLTHSLTKEMHVHYGKTLVKKHKKHYDLAFNQGDDALDLRLSVAKKPALWGDNGVIPMGNKGDSYYYSFPRMKAEGTLTLQGEKKKVSGIVWMDHQWGEWDLLDDRWVWFAVQLSDNTDLMVFSFENPSTHDTIRFGGIALPSGRVVMTGVRLKPTRHWTSAKTRRKYAVGWRLELPERKTKLSIIAAFPQQEMADPRTPPYYEGSCAVSGTVGKKAVTGRAYLEIADFSKKWVERKYR